MLSQLVTRTEGISVRVIRMLSQLVRFGLVERASVKLDIARTKTFPRHLLLEERKGL